MKRLVFLSIALMALVAVTGCKRGSVIKDEKTFDLEPTVPHILYIPAAKKFEVNFTSKDNVPVNVYVMSKADGEATEKASSVTGKKMGSQVNTASGKVANTSADKVEMAVVFESNKKASVTATITGE